MPTPSTSSGPTTQDRLVRGVAGLLGLCLIVFVLAKARNAFQEYNYIGKQVRDRDVITISGEGKVTARPDVAKLTIGVMSEGAKVADIQRSNTDKMNAIVAAVKQLGVDAKDIQTSCFTIYPQYDWTSGKQTLRGYQVSQMVTVKVRNLDRAGDVLAKAGDLGANNVSGPEFVIDDPSALRDQARDKAIEDARKKAQELADKLDLDIVKVVSFSESGGGYPGPVPMYAAKLEAGNVAADASMPAPAIEAGSTDVTSNVNVTFEVN